LTEYKTRTILYSHAGAVVGTSGSVRKGAWEMVEVTQSAQAKLKEFGQREKVEGAFRIYLSHG